MGSQLFLDAVSPQTDTDFSVEGVHEPDALARESGLWIASAGASMLACGKHPLRELDSWLWIAFQTAGAALGKEGFSLDLAEGDSCMVPPLSAGLSIDAKGESRVIWFTVSGRLAERFMLKLGALPHWPMRQTALPSQLKLAASVVQAAVRVAGSSEASSSQLQQLLWAMLASHSGQPVAMGAVLSHQIAKVVDAMRRTQYRDNYSLKEMAGLSRMPAETFRKRFVAEVGMPPQNYQLFCKMERAKTLLKEGHSVRAAGVGVGMSDPYHFSKTFKKFIGMSPSAYSRTAQL